MAVVKSSNIGKSNRIPTSVQLILLYIFVAYIIPQISIIATEHRSFIYYSFSLSAINVVYSMLLFSSAIIGAYWGSIKFYRNEYDLKKPAFLVEITFLFIAIIVLLFSFRDGLSQWRYSSTGISANLSLQTLVIILIVPFLELIVIYDVFFSRHVSNKEIKQRRIITSLVCLALILSASGIGSSVLILIAIFNIIFRDFLRSMIFKRDKFSSESTGYLVAIGLMASIIILPLASVALIFGQMIKVGGTFNEALNYYLSSSASDFLYYAIERFSTAVVSLKVSLYYLTTLDSAQTFQNLTAPLNNFLLALWRAPTICKYRCIRSIRGKAPAQG
jgi:hypothetical protein